MCFRMEKKGIVTQWMLDKPIAIPFRCRIILSAGIVI